MWDLFTSSDKINNFRKPYTYIDKKGKEHTTEIIIRGIWKSADEFRVYENGKESKCRYILSGERGDGSPRKYLDIINELNWGNDGEKRIRINVLFTKNIGTLAVNCPSFLRSMTVRSSGATDDLSDPIVMGNLQFLGRMVRPYWGGLSYEQKCSLYHTAQIFLETIFNRYSVVLPDTSQGELTDKRFREHFAITVEEKYNYFKV